MVSVAQLVEPWIVIPVVVGSSPIVHPIYSAKSGCRNAPLFCFSGQRVGQAAAAGRSIAPIGFGGDSVRHRATSFLSPGGGAERKTDEDQQQTLPSCAPESAPESGIGDRIHTPASRAVEDS